MTTTLEKVRRAMDRAWLDAIEQCGREGKSAYPRDIIRSHLARAAIQALIDDAGFESYPSHPKTWLQAILDEQKETAPQ